MRSLLRYLVKNSSVLIFILLEILSLFLVINYNKYQSAKFFNSSNYITASVYESYTSVVDYFELRKINQQLAEENAALKMQFQKYQNSIEIIEPALENVENAGVKNEHISAKVINVSVNKPYNFITLNKGSKHGIKPEQGIISAKGVVGLITNVSDFYSTGFTVLNLRWSVSAKLKKSGTYGPLAWDGKNYKIAELNEIPFHININVGDTVVTSAYSYTFPEGILIGTIQSFSKSEGENYYNIKVELATDFKSLSFVEVINNIDKKEIENLVNISMDGQDNN